MNQDSNIDLLSTENLSQSRTYNFKTLIDSSVEIGHSNLVNDSPYSDINIDSKYYDLDEFIGLDHNPHNFSFLSLNIQSLSSKYIEFKQFHNQLSENKCNFDIYALQEVYSIIDPDIFHLDNYHPIQFKTRTVNKGGGVAFFISKSLKFKVIDELSIFQEKMFESMFIKVSLNDNSNIIIGNIYRSPTNLNGITPSEQLDGFLEILSNILENLDELNCKVYLLGDFNIDLLKFNNHPKTSEFIDKFFSNGYLQLVNHPSRVSQHANQKSASLIDHIWTNNISQSLESGIITSYLSDHFPIYHILSAKKKNVAPKKIKFRDFSETNIALFKHHLSHINFNDVMQENDAQVSYDIFHSKFFDLYNLVFVEKELRFNRNIHQIEPWMSRGLLTSRQNKNKLSKNYSKRPSFDNLDKFKTYKNVYNKLLKAMKKLYYHNEIVKHQGDLKKIWETIRKASGINKKHFTLPDELNVNGQTIKDKNKIADAFNKHFTSIASKIKNDITPTDKPPDEYLEELDLDFNLPEISHLHVISAFGKLKDKSSSDFMNISSSFIKHVINEISKPLGHIFNRSFITGIIPDKLKISKISPIYKRNGEISDMNNFRPISLISIFSKILEKIVALYLRDFLTSNNIIDEYQFGFQENNSTSHPMIHMLNKIAEAINKKEYTIGIFCDLTKAFDMVPIRLLITKLNKIGVRGSASTWFYNYLSKRQQFVQIENEKSSLLEVESGVPQGSILGPILFLIFFNDLLKSSSLFMLLFCDDTTILASGPNLNELVNKVNIELRKISQWFRSNGMALHPLKTKFTVFHSPGQVIPWDEINLVIDENDPNCSNYNLDLKKKLEYVNNDSDIPAVKFLGVYFDPTLSFKYHIDQLNIKLSKALFLLRRAKNILDVDSLTSLYFSTFHSHLIYGILIYSSAVPTVLNSLIIKQKMAIRCISNSKYNAHTAPLFKKFNILPFDFLVKYFQLQFMHDYKFNQLPRSFNSVWRTVAESNVLYPMRNNQDYRIVRARICLTERLPICKFPKIWNEYHSDILKNIFSKNAFKSKLRKDLLEAIDIVCTRLLCPICHLRL